MDAQSSNAGILTAMTVPTDAAVWVPEAVQFPGYSGYPGCGPESECIRCLGPIPEGTYEAEAWRPYKHTIAMNIAGAFCAGRDLFRIHGGGPSASPGCIVIPAVHQLKAWMDDHRCRYPVRLEVIYSIPSGGDCSTNEIPTSTLSATCNPVHPGPHTCRVGCAPQILGPPQDQQHMRATAITELTTEGDPCR